MRPMRGRGSRRRWCAVLTPIRHRGIREQGGEPSSRQVDELLEERLAHRGRAREGGANNGQTSR
jgi:hypothetical protein